jgi:prepilin-type N-terminal cleavage/methylation domain-containing protein
MQNPPASRKQRGFTLVEMSVVLILAGLLVAAVTAGQDLINTAKAKKAVRDITTLSSQLHLYAQSKGRLPGDCDADGVIDYAADTTTRLDTETNTRAIEYAFSSALPTIPDDGAEAVEQTDGCALTGGDATVASLSTVVPSPTNANVWLNDLKLAGMVSDSAPNRNLAKTLAEDFLFVGKITDDGGASAALADYNAIVMHNVPQWMAISMAQAINGQDAVANRSRLRSLNRAANNGTYESTWQVMDSTTDPAMRDALVTVAYFFDQVPESQGPVDE